MFFGKSLTGNFRSVKLNFIYVMQSLLAILTKYQKKEVLGVDSLNYFFFKYQGHFLKVYIKSWYINIQTFNTLLCQLKDVLSLRVLRVYYKCLFNICMIWSKTFCHCVSNLFMFIKQMIWSQRLILTFLACL